MNQWQQGFVKRVDALRESGFKRFEAFAEEVVARVYEEYSQFASQHDFNCGVPQFQRGSRLYKFALSEDAYVLLYFRSRGIDSVECEYECSVPGRGCVESDRNRVALGDATRPWVERCFQVGLDDLITRVSAGAAAKPAPELVGA